MLSPRVLKWQKIYDTRFVKKRQYAPVLQLIQ